MVLVAAMYLVVTRTLLWAPTALFDHVLRRPQVGMTLVTPGPGTEDLPHERTQAGQRLYLALMQAVRFAVGGVVRAQDDRPLVEDCVTLATACLRAAQSVHEVAAAAGA